MLAAGVTWRNDGTCGLWWRYFSGNGAVQTTVARQANLMQAVSDAEIH